MTLSGKAVFTFCETACRYILATVLSTDHCKYTSRSECYIIVRFFLSLHCIGFWQWQCVRVVKMIGIWRSVQPPLSWPRSLVFFSTLNANYVLTSSFRVLQSASATREDWSIDLHWVRDLAVPMHLGLMALCSHNQISAQESPVPLLKFQMALRIKILIPSGSKKWTQIRGLFKKYRTLIFSA